MSGLVWFAENQSGFSGQLLKDEPLSKHTYYRIGGKAPLLLIPQSKKDLEWIRDGIRASGCTFEIIGLGSNLLVADSGLKSIVIKSSRINLDIELIDENRLRVGASVSVSTLLRKAGQEGWGKLEFMTGVPGSMGGVVFMNAGTHLGEAKDRIRSVETFDLLGERGWQKFEGDSLKFEYRKNLFLPASTLIFETIWEIEKQDPVAVKARIDETLVRRKQSQPLDYPSCGSVFKNPPEKRAWEIIESLKLRGHRIGNAQFSEKHPNFIVNLGGASSEDVYELIQLAKSRARAELGIELHEEVKYVPARA